MEPEIAEHEAAKIILQQLSEFLFDRARNATLSNQEFATFYQILLDAGNQELADSFANAYHGGIATAFNLAVQSAMQHEQAARLAWDRALQLNPGDAEAFRRRSLLSVQHSDGAAEATEQEKIETLDNTDMFNEDNISALNMQNIRTAQEDSQSLFEILQAALKAAEIGELLEDNYLFLKSISTGNPFIIEMLDHAWNFGMERYSKRIMQNNVVVQEDMESRTGDADEINSSISFIRRIESAKAGTLRDRSYFCSLNSLLSGGGEQLADQLMSAWHAGIVNKDHTFMLPVDSSKMVAQEIEWPPNKKTNINDLISLHRSPVPAAVGTYKRFIQSINLGVLSSDQLIDLSENKIKPLPMFVVDMNNALLYKGADFVVDTSHPGGALLYNSAIDSITHFPDWLKMHDNRGPKEAFFLKGSTLLIGGTWEENFFHFVFEVLGRCGTFERFGYSFSDVDRILVSQNPSDNRWDWFRSLGIADKITVAPDCFLLCERLLLPSLSPMGAPLETISYLRNKIAPSHNGKKRIFVSRGNKKNGRALMNAECFFDTVLKPVGFEMVTMDGMTVREQADTFCSASHIIAPNGAALSNLIFSAPHVKVLEIFGKSYINPAILHLANQLDIQHHHVVCEELNERGSFSDFYIDIEKIDMNPFLAE